MKNDCLIQSFNWTVTKNQEQSQTKNTIKFSLYIHQKSTYMDIYELLTTQTQ